MDRDHSRDILTRDILISFIGKRDPFTEERKDGPILTILSSGKLKNVKDIIFFHVRSEAFTKRAKDLRIEILKRWGIESQIHELSVEDPTDLLGLYKELRSFFLERAKKFRAKNLKYFLSSGTPQMQICLFLLASSGEFSGSLIYQPDPKFGKPPREIRLDHEIFPCISPPRKIPKLIEILDLPEELLRIAEELGIFVGSNPVFCKALQDLYHFARDARSVLLFGETGTGKEVLARLYHQLSPRRDKPFITLNVTTLPDTLFEAELFGHVKGAFTGALRDRSGLVETAKEGILFLDEIGELKPELQAKLLRLIEYGEYRKLGSDQIQKAENLVFVFATNKDLKELTKQGKFREDLFHRLYHYHLYIPPLRERREDLKDLITFLLQKISKSMKRELLLSPDALELLSNYSFPGNIRELKNILERASSLTTNKIIDISHIELPFLEENPHPRDYLPDLPYEGFDFKRTCDLIKDWYYKKAFFLSGGSPTKAGKLLSCSHVNIIKHWKKLGLYYDEKEEVD